jgi:hypothetical protein
MGEKIIPFWPRLPIISVSVSQQALDENVMDNIENTVSKFSNVMKTSLGIF